MTRYSSFIVAALLASAPIALNNNVSGNNIVNAAELSPKGQNPQEKHNQDGNPEQNPEEKQDHHYQTDDNGHLTEQQFEQIVKKETNNSKVTNPGDTINTAFKVSAY